MPSAVCWAPTLRRPFVLSPDTRRRAGAAGVAVVELRAGEQVSNSDGNQ